MSAQVEGPTAGPLQTARAVALAVAVVTIALGAHLLGGGGAPGALTLAGGTALVLAVASLLSRRRLRLPVIMVFLPAGQLLLHGVFMIGSGGHAMGSPAPGPFDSLAPPMITAHVLATGVCTLVLHRGEAALWVVRAFVSRRLPPALRPYLVPPSAAPVLVPVRVARTRMPLPNDADRRGPPCRVSS